MMGFRDEKRVLALDVRPLRFGFVIFEGPNQVLDWGVKSFPQGAKAVKVPPAKKIVALLDEFTPQAVVLKKRVAHRSKNYVRMARSIGRQAENLRVPVRFVTRAMAGSWRVWCAAVSAVGSIASPLAVSPRRGGLTDAMPVSS